MDSATQSLWGLDHNDKLVDPKRDALYNYDGEAQRALGQTRPWGQDPNYFKHVRIGAMALMKMTMHARSGGDLEVMGLMQGYVDGDTFIVTDAFRLPVEGTETRVNVQDEANEYIIEYLDSCRRQGRQENVVGWYHSHPGYGCWLSGIDVDTQSMQQQFQDPFLAVVIDPDRTVSAGKVDIGAFRTYPLTYRAETGSGKSDGFQAVPLAKAAEFGAHANRYYSLEVSPFKSTLDSLLLESLRESHWPQTMGQNSLDTNRDYDTKQMLDLRSKINEETAYMAENKRTQKPDSIASHTGREKRLETLAKDANMIATKQRSGQMTFEIKTKIFNNLDMNETQ
ncbi:COP9 signalosome catalytic subunit rri1 [Conoideocrella luteorostrata]|uniref:COP9 signalosome complex subunit 5 n=1 Tax=Conoideocrella luteorostrata TaxID=1105319 RepID=A0AAJ0CQN5_9HYPO|nr:COP9 signalosome catalytic subunit rri1 [Conoideocrella luteorostrata]